jgi:hypothetical protein
MSNIGTWGTVPGVGVVEGLLSASAGKFSDSAGVVYPSSDIPVATAMSGSFSSKTSLSGTLNPTLSLTAPFPQNAMPIAFNGDYNALYDTPATVAEAQGTWTGQTIGSSSSLGSASLTVGADGLFSGSSGTCSFNGSIAPRPTGKHVLDGTVTFTSGWCVQPSGANSMAIEAVVYGNQHNQLFVAGVTAQRDRAFVVLATK